MSARVPQQIVRLPLLRTQLVESLREAIVGGEFRPGGRLVDARLCERFGVSRGVVREAIRQLEVEGLVEIENRGPVVARLTPRSARALYEVRAALEGLAGALFAQRADSNQIAALRRSLAEVAQTYKGQDLGEKLRGKDRFFSLLVEGADNELVRSTLRGIYARVQLLRGLSLQVEGRAEQSLQELGDIVDAVERRDVFAARSACELHVLRAAAVVDRVLGKEVQVETAALQQG